MYGSPSCSMACGSLGHFAGALMSPGRKQSIALSVAQNLLLIKLSSGEDCKILALMLQGSRGAQGHRVIIRLLNNTDTQWLNYCISQRKRIVVISTSEHLINEIC